MSKGNADRGTGDFFIDRGFHSRGGRTMRQGKFKFLLVTVLVVSGLLFAGGEARANFTNFCYTVNGTVSNANKTFTYTFNPLVGCTSNTSVKSVLFEIPYEVPSYTTFQAQYLTPSTSLASLTCRYLGQGIGDPGTRLGTGDTRYNVLSCDSPTTGGFPKNYSIVLTLTPDSTKLSTEKKHLDSAIQIVQLKSGNSLSDTDVIPQPLISADPALPPPIITSFSASPNPVQLITGRATCTTLSWSATFASGDSGTVSISDGVNNHAGLAATGTLQDCPLVTTTYTITATGGGGGTSTATAAVTVNSAGSAPNFGTDGLIAIPSSITSGQEPFCVTLQWNAGTGTVAISANNVELASGLPPTNGSFTVCPVGTTTYTATATSNGGTSTATAIVTVDAPVIQTSCMQIIKKPKDQDPACINVCFEIGGAKRLTSAELYLNANCSGPATKIAVFGPDVDNPALRVSSLQCSPCGIDAGADGKTPDCSGIPYGPGKAPPFDLDLETNMATCEFILDSIQPTGTTFDLGADPQFYNGRYYMNVSICPTGYVNCNGFCKTTCP